MPYGDRTGPLGEGPMTGRRMGYCAGYNSAGNSRGYGYGRGRGAGYGYGRGYGFRQENWNIPQDVPQRPVQSSDEVSGLRSEIEGLKNSINAILERLDSGKKEKE
jgi:hypothetical protein